MSAEEVSVEEAVATYCPVCGARPGRPCWTLEHKVKRVPHAIRYAAARELRSSAPREPSPLDRETEERLAGSPTEALVWLSQWIDAGNAHRDPEAVTWGRLSKVAEEAGEVIAAYIGMTGQNPRKGVTASLIDVQEELLDVAVTALGALVHLGSVDPIADLNAKVVKVTLRAQWSVM